jgi:hypothetical protein
MQSLPQPWARRQPVFRCWFIEDNTKFDFNDALYPRMLEQGMSCMAHIVVPVKGNYFLWLGVHDNTSDAAGAMEIPAVQIRSGVAVPGFLAP